MKFFRTFPPLPDRAIDVCRPGLSARREAWDVSRGHHDRIPGSLAVVAGTDAEEAVAARLGLDPKTVRRYLRAAEAAGLRAQPEALSDEQVRDVLLSLQPGGEASNAHPKPLAQ